MAVGSERRVLLCCEAYCIHSIGAVRVSLPSKLQRHQKAYTVTAPTVLYRVRVSCFTVSGARVPCEEERHGFKKRPRPTFPSRVAFQSVASLRLPTCGTCEVAMQLARCSSHGAWRGTVHNGARSA